MSLLRAILDLFGLPPPKKECPDIRKRDPMLDLVNTAHTQNEEIWKDLNERRVSRGEEPLEPYRVSVERLYGIDRD